ncbi:MAG TPA: hypothetical protein VF345_00350 [Chthoniobacterales bacterium]
MCSQLPATQVTTLTSWPKVTSGARKALLFLFSLAVLLAGGAVQSAPEGFVPGPDIVVGDISDLAQYGATGTPPPQLGLGVGATACNAGNVEVGFIEMPNTDHPVIAHNLYRMSAGSGNDERFEQIGQSWVKHTFGAANFDECGFGCTGGEETHLGVGCSDTYFSSQNATQSLLGSRAWVNPFTGFFQANARDHTGHIETGTSHRILVESNDLNTTMNPGATYYAEVQYITPDEYAWCQAHPGQCNMYNNASYRRFNVTTNFTFSPVGATARASPAINAWTGATINAIEPEPGSDGRAFIAYKVTNPSAGVWHYEYALYNQNLDRGVQSLSVPLGGLITVSNPGFHAPLNHPGFPNDGTLGDAGYSNAAWASNQTGSALSWSTETFAQNQNANAIRWGTLYNFRFDSNRPPQATTATIGFFKTGTPITVGILGPDASNATPTPIPTVTPGATATPTPTATPAPTPTPTPGGTPARAVNLSTRMLVGTGDNVGIGGFIVTATMQIVVRAIGPSLAQVGVPNALADPVLELHGPDGFLTLTNDNWRDDGSADTVENLGLAPFYEEESAMYINLLSRGNYTVVVRGKDNTSGVALVEVYSVGFGNLANISTRAVVGTGDDIVIAGFILGGYTGINPNTGADRVVVRGIGPRLASFGVENALADPTLELRDGNGALLIANNDWRDDPVQAAELTAAHLAPISPLEAGIAATLPPGLYTALLAGLNNGTGTGLVEVYDLGAP